MTARARPAEPSRSRNARPAGRSAPASRPASRQGRPAGTPRQAPRTGAARRPSPRVAARRRAVWLWIPLVAILLGGIVWINVAKLRLTTQTSRVVERSNQVQSETIRLNAALQQRNAEVRDEAGRRLGMIPSSNQTVWLQAPPAATGR